MGKSVYDKVLVIAAGITLSQAIPAIAKECGGRILVVEDHYPEGGIGDAVAEVICDKRDFVLRKQCVREVPRSGPPMVLLEKYGIGTNAIMKGVEDMMHL